MHLKTFADLKATIIDDKTHLPVKETVDFSLFLENTNISKNTILTYLKGVCRWYQFCESNNIDPIYVFSDVSKSAINIFGNFMNSLATNGLKSSSINLYLTAIYRFYDYLALSGKIENGPLQIFPVEFRRDNKGFLNGLVTGNSERISSLAYMKKDPSSPLEYVSWEQYEQILSACMHVRDKVLVGLMFECGLRIGEALGIHVEDIRLEDNTIDLKYRANNKNNAFVKEQASRKIVLSERLAKNILYLLFQIEEYGSEYIFVTMYSKNGENGKPLSYIAAKKICDGISKRSNVTFHPHMLRHGYAQERLNDGWQLAEISKTMGHASVLSTQQYAQFNNDYIKAKQLDFLEERAKKNDKNYEKND